MRIQKFKTKEEWLNMRLQDVTSTEISALFGLNPYMTEFELYHQKKNKEIIILEDNPRMTWGTRLEEPIARGVAEDNGWTVHPFKEYASHDELRAGSSFDYLVAIPNEAGDGMIEGLLEIKNVDGLQLKMKWEIEDGKVTEAPAHIELQIQHQMMITGHPFCYIAALVGGNSVQLLKRTPNENIISAIKAKIIKFWNSVENDLPPSPDFEKDAEFISKLYGFAEPNKVMDVPDEKIDELAAKYALASEDEKMAKKRKAAAKAEMLMTIGDTEKVLGENYTVSCGVTGPTIIKEFERKSFRGFRIHWKKEKK